MPNNALLQVHRHSYKKYVYNFAAKINIIFYKTKYFEKK